MQDFFDVNEEAASALAKEAENIGQSTSDTRWLKMNEGQHRLRITPAWSEEGLFVRSFQRHRGPFQQPYTTLDNYNVQPLCLKWILKEANESFRNILIQMGRLDEETLTLAKKYGCPLDWLPKNIMSRDGETKYKKDVAKLFWATTRHLFNVVYVDGPGPAPKGRVHAWDTSNAIYQAIMANVGLRPDLFHPKKGCDILVTATGEGSKRRYTKVPLMAAPDATPLDTPDGPYNLDELAGKSARKWDDLVSIINNSHTSFGNERFNQEYVNDGGSGIQVGDDDIPF